MKRRLHRYKIYTKQQSPPLYDYHRDYTTSLTASVGTNGFATLPDAKGVTARLEEALHLVHVQSEVESIMIMLPDREASIAPVAVSRS